MTTDNATLVREMVETVLNRKDLNALDQYVAENFIELDPAPGQGPGREGLRQVFAGLFESFPDMHWTIEEQISDNDKVVSRFTWTATHSGPFAGIPATGNALKVKGVVIDHFADGMMTDSRILSDELGVLHQLGIIPAPPAA
jgi:steroid delta-isomerase-like uncharacterized protein